MKLYCFKVFQMVQIGLENIDFEFKQDINLEIEYLQDIKNLRNKD